MAEEGMELVAEVGEGLVGGGVVIQEGLAVEEFAGLVGGGAAAFADPAVDPVLEVGAAAFVLGMEGVEIEIVVGARHQLVQGFGAVGGEGEGFDEADFLGGGGGYGKGKEPTSEATFHGRILLHPV